MKTLIISDVHANYEALGKIVSLENWDRIVCLGDIVDFGPSPEECISLIKEKAGVCVRGNHDNAVAFGVDCGCGYEIKDLSIDVRKYTNKVISQQSKDYLKELPLVASYNNQFYTHASVNNLFKYLKPDTPKKEFSEFEDLDEEMIFLGHTHIPMDRKIKGKRFLNPGSLGQPRDGDVNAPYIILEEGNLIKERIDYDREKVIKKMKKVSLPERAMRILRDGKVVP
ncbi:MAG: metallophosphoesterase family protein [Thermoplasmatota archaeon]